MCRISLNAKFRVVCIVASCMIGTAARGAPWLDRHVYRESADSCLRMDAASPSMERFQVPLAVADRRRFRDVQVIGRFSDYRSSAFVGHLHAGVDLIPKGSSVGQSFPVLAAGYGQVCAVILERPHKTVIVKHKTGDGARFTVYKHLSQVAVEVGDLVLPVTYLGLTEPAGPHSAVYSHLHFEIRKTLNDGGFASYSVYHLTDLRRLSIDPLFAIGI